MNNDKRTICKLFYRMDMFYLINKKNFLSQKVGPGGASIYIYINIII